MSEDFINYAEYGVERRAEGKNKLARMLLVFLYIVFASSYAGFFISVRIPQVIALLPIFLWILVFFTWRLVKYDCEYKIEQGEMIFFISYSAKRKKEKLRIRVKDAKKIIPEKEYDRGTEEFFDFRGSKKCSDGYVIVYEQGGKEIAVAFEAIPQALKILKRLNPDSVI